MPIVFIHGVPDTSGVWDELREKLTDQKSIALALPGFGTSVPRDFTSTKEEYVAWLIEQLERISGPVDLVGHDWGCILALRVVSLRPDLVRSWAAGSGPVSKQYEWHPLAKIWQTPRNGEEWMANLNRADFAKFMAQSGVPMEAANEKVAHIDEKMKDSILRLYRSATHVGEQWQPDLQKVDTPGLVFWGEKDTACPPSFADELAGDTKARRLLKLDCGHWVQLERTLELAQALEEHWSSVPNDAVR